MSEEFVGFGYKGDREKIEKGGSDPFPDGETKVLGIEKFIKTDDRELPIFVPSNDGNMVARFVLKLTADEAERTGRAEGPAMSATKAELAGLVRAFGGDPSKLPAGEDTAFLLAVQEQIGKNVKPKKAKVYKGWVQYVDGGTPPETTYTWKYAGARSVDRSEPVRFMEKEFTFKGKKIAQDVVFLNFEIVGDAYGKPSPYNGYSIEIKVNNPFDGVDDRGMPAYRAGKTGGTPIDVERFGGNIDMTTGFVPLFCDLNKLFKRTWESDPEKSEYGINELDNPLLVIHDNALKAKRFAAGPLKYTDGGMPKLELDAFFAANPDLTPSAASITSTKVKYNLHSFIEDTMTPELKVFKPSAKDSDELNWMPTEEGKEFLKSNVAPVWDELKLPLGDKGQRAMGLLSDENAQKLLAALAAKLGEPIPFDTDDVEEAAF